MVLSVEECAFLWHRSIGQARIDEEQAITQYAGQHR
jgi:hypothetical protein